VAWSWAGALTAFFWAGIVRIGLLHHITWSINSVPCVRRAPGWASNVKWPDQKRLAAKLIKAGRLAQGHGKSGNPGRMAG
jgi:hypothetical protein